MDLNISKILNLPIHFPFLPPPEEKEKKKPNTEMLLG